MEQLSLFPAALRVGAYIEEHGRRLAWDELQVGMTVIYDCSTESHEWLMVTTVEKIIRTPDDLRVILDGGRKQRPLINRCHIESGRTKLYREAWAQLKENIENVESRMKAIKDVHKDMWSAVKDHNGDAFCALAGEFQRSAILLAMEWTNASVLANIAVLHGEDE